ncbi:hypothetical protein ACFLTI_06015 [Bacteroidota bacterium]
MASPILITLKLDSFYQRFLRSYYSCEEPVMEFPRKDDFNTLLAYLVAKFPMHYFLRFYSKGWENCKELVGENNRKISGTSPTIVPGIKCCVLGWNVK